MKYILPFNPRVNSENPREFNSNCKAIITGLHMTSTISGSGARTIRRALRGVRRITGLNANWFIYFNFSYQIDPTHKRLQAIRVTESHNGAFWSYVLNNLIRQLGMNVEKLKRCAYKAE